ncbi:MAG: excinuclease ABC subunit UvrA [Verrucomicrobiales bacterium]
MASRSKSPKRPEKSASKKTTPRPAAAGPVPAAVDGEVIRLRGVRQNNLKGFDLALPLGSFTVVTGPSGSGKSSLAFQTLYAEGQRRYVETFSPYVRQFFDRMDKPRVDRIEGIPPAIAIEQVNNVRTTRSTVGTITEINDYLKVLFARVARGYCPKTGLEVRPDTVDSVRSFALAELSGQAALVLFPVPVPTGTAPADFFSFLQQQGFLRVRIYGKIHRTDEPEAYQKKTLPAILHVVQDRVTPDAKNMARFTEAVESAFHLGKGELMLAWDNKNGETKEKTFTRDWLCPESGIRLRPPTPGLFSFNSPIGACPKCRGFGKVIGLDLEKALPDKSLSIRGGVVRAFQGETYRESQDDLIKHARREGISLETPFDELDQEEQDWILYGDPECKDPEEAWEAGKWYGVKGFFDWLEKRTYKMHVRVFLSRFRSYTNCPDCRGGRLQPEALNFRIGGKALPDLARLPVDTLLPFLEQEVPPSMKTRDGQPLDPATETVRKEILSRLRYLEQTGLGYLSLDRETRTLSGGETARVNLTTCLGASLTGTLFVLDEPTVGLHPRDTGRLLDIMRSLRDRGNTLVVVEHEESVMRASDHLVDIGPGRGIEGGELLYSGGTREFLAHGVSRASLTHAYLTGKKDIVAPAKRRKPKGRIAIRRASEHNLKKIDVDVPLGVFCCVTGVSGSGKSTLVHRVLHAHLAREFGAYDGELEPGRCKSIDHGGKLRQVVLVDQSPLARTPRSTPAVYTGMFDPIRQIFARLPEAEAAGLTSGYFSFNGGPGRCQRCMGMGWERVEMQFLSDLFVTCPECEGRRYTNEALVYKLEGKSIADVLELSVDEAIPFFAALPGKSRDQRVIANSLNALAEVGLGYLKLGQPLNTLSGGEAQRLKLVSHLLEASPERAASTALLFDEPTTGLHFDDIARLLVVFHRLVAQGYSLIVIEHNLDVILQADHVIDLGPEAGAAGGEVVASGTPEEIAKNRASLTGKHLSELLARRSSHDMPMAAEEAASYGRRSPANNAITIHGAREHNLKNLTLDIPRDEFVVVTGLSGSGKSTLAFDIIFAEGQRRFLDSMSPYARQFAEQMEKPDVDHIDGLPPTVAIEQRVSRGGGKSTVGTVTEVYHFLRLLYAKVGIQHCPESGLPVVAQTPQAIATTILETMRGGPVVVLGPVLRARKGFHTDVAEAAGRKGYTKLLVDNQFMEIDGFRPLERYKPHDIDIVVEEFAKSRQPDAKAVLTAVEAALAIGHGMLRILGPDKKFQPLSTKRVSPATGKSFDDLEPNTFSFNSPRGWCPACRGYGLVPRRPRALDTQGADSALEAEMAEERRMEDQEEMDLVPCEVCGGSRLHESARAVRVLGHRIEDVVCHSVTAARGILEGFHFDGREALIARDILPEILQRLRFMEEVGLGYLQLDRSATTLSGGEAQRIRLAAQLGSNLRGVLYVLDEPTIGLHPRDNEKLLSTLHALHAKGNSLLVVEHDEDTIRRAGHLIDLGPGAGRLGGEIMYSGKPDAGAEKKGKAGNPNNSATLRALGEPMQHPVRGKRRPLPAPGDRAAWLTVEGAKLHNLRGLDVSIPRARLTVITGVSGSGKSTFMRGVLSPAADAVVKGKGKAPKDARWSALKGFEGLEMVYEVDQSPIGKTSRSTPGTYVKVFDEIRSLYARLPDSRLRGYEASRFSFNTEGGRCETCQGNGRIKIEMAFLPTTWVPCEECRGQRYNPATLEVLYYGKSIGDVMGMTIAEAAVFFESHPKIQRTLALLNDTGLGYLQLGQASPTLSGGEAQRIKLVSQLTRGAGRSATDKMKGRKHGGCLYLIEEPTIGLHLEDVARLIDVLHRLVDDGHTVVVIEHNIDVMKEADYLIDIGPEAGPAGGKITAAGTPEQVSKSKVSRTAPFLR